MHIVLDGMGSDNYPDPEVAAAVQAADLFGDEIILVGNQQTLEPKLKAISPEHPLVRIHHAPDVVDMSDKAVDGTRNKPENSMAVGLELVKSGKADAFITAGNSGAAMFNAIKILHRSENIVRPVLITSLPTRSGKCVFLDTGANADCRSDFLYEFAIMASVYAEKVLNINHPRVGLLSNGEETGKGNQLVREAHLLLKNSNLNFIGNVESKEVFGGTADVVVADGFTGNIFIKTSEAVSKYITDILREEISSSMTRKLGYLLIKPAFTRLKKIMDPAEVGAAMLLGVNGCVFIGHGRSDSRALVSAIRLARQAVDANLASVLPDEIKLRLKHDNSAGLLK